MKKVMFMIPNLKGGGAEKVLVDILNNINKKKFEITLILLQNDGVFINELSEGIDIKFLNKKGKLIEKIQTILIKYLPSLFYRIKIREKYDVEVAFLEGKAAKLISKSNNKSSRKFVWIHTDLKNFNWIKNIFFSKKDEEKCYSKFNDIVFVSNESKDAFENIYYNKSKKHVIYNPIIDKDIISKSINYTLEKKDSLNLVSVGRLVKVKGFDRLIKIHSKIVKEYPHNLIIVGDGIEKENLIKLIENLNVNESVKLVGFKKNPYPYIRQSDIYICSSYAEGFSLSVLEAVILKKAILSMDVTGPREILDFGEYGVLCKDESELEKNLKDLLNNREKIKYYENRSAILSKKFNYKRIIKQIENLIDAKGEL
ncbi:glycosyltransferase [Clostridium perfringens]